MLKIESSAEPLAPGPAGPITAVLFDFSSTLVDIGEPELWLEAAWRRSGRGGSVRAGLGQDGEERLVRGLRHFWDDLRVVDPDGQRDLTPARHRKVFGVLLERLSGVDQALGQALYDALPEVFTPYEEALPTLSELKRRGVRLALVSNIAMDLRPMLKRWHLLDLFDTVVLSFETGSVKPQAAIFQRALDGLAIAPGHALMVGDDPLLDSGAALLGIRTLLLPRTRGRSHGLDLVLRVVN